MEEKASEEKELPEKPKGRERSGTMKSSKEKKSVFGTLTGEFAPLFCLVLSIGRYETVRVTIQTLPSATDLFANNKAPVISTPYDPVHLTHVGFNQDTGECELVHETWSAVRMRI